MSANPYRAGNPSPPAPSAPPTRRCSNCQHRLCSRDPVDLGLGASYAGNDHCRRCVSAWVADFARYERLRAPFFVRWLLRGWDRLTRRPC